MKSQPRRFIAPGFTLLELLVVLAIVSIVISIALPAIGSARESARITQCQNRLRQLVMAGQLHESAIRHYPTNGWGYRWLGDNRFGFGEDQPGGWIFNSLLYLELDTLHARMTPGLLGAIPAEPLEVPLPAVRCPSRPGEELGPMGKVPAPFNSASLSRVAKSDFAICEGDVVTDTKTGPTSSGESTRRAYQWADTSLASGVSYQRSQVKAAWIIDGLSQTYYCGEKHVAPVGYFSAKDPGHDQSALSGVDIDLNRWTSVLPRQDGAKYSIRAFGSAHGSGFSMAYCDGSVQMLAYTIDVEIHRQSGNRNDKGASQ